MPRRRYRRLGVLSAAAMISMCATTSGTAGAASDVPNSSAVTYAQLNAQFPKFTQHVTLTWWTWQAGTASIVKGFEQHYPTIKINTVTFGGGSTLYPKLTAALKSGHGAPDVAMVEESELPQFVNTGGLAPITQYAAPFRKFFPQWIWGQCTFNNSIYAVPDDGDALGLYFIPSLMAKYHLAIPTTWAQFATEAATLHKENPKVYLTYFDPENTGLMQGLEWQAGVTPFQDTAGGWKINLDTSAATKVLQYWTTLVKAGDIPLVTSSTQLNNELASNTFLSQVGPPWYPKYSMLPTLGAKETAQWRAALIPQWNSASPSDGNWGGTTMAVTAQTKNPEAAALWALYDNLAETSIESVDSGGITASYLGLDTPGFFAPNPILGGQEDLRIFSKLDNEVNTHYQYSPWTAYAEQLETTQFDNAAAGKESAQQALANVQSGVLTFAKTTGAKVA